MIEIAVVGGLFDGARVAVPRRTPPGLRMLLASADGAGEYLLVGGPNGALQIVCDTPAAGAEESVRVIDERRVARPR